MARATFAETRTWEGSRRANEDYALIDEGHGCAVLVDGGTGLTGANIVEGESDAAWYARDLCERAIGRLADDSLGMTDALGLAARETADAYLAFPGATDLARESLPNGSLSVMRWAGDELEVAMLGDCTAAVALRDGTVNIIHDPTLDALDRENYGRMWRYVRENGTTMAQARQAVNDWFVHTRLMMNEPGGYWAADVSCRGFGHEMTERFPLDDVAGAIMFSDGYAAAVRMGVVGDMGELAAGTLGGYGVGIAERLRSAEREDGMLMRVHRSKVSDDATYVAMRFV